MKILKLLQRNFLYILLPTVLFVGCNNAQLGGKKVEQLQQGDTIFVKYAGEYLMAIVDENYKKHKIIACRRNNIYDTKGDKPWVCEKYKYSELRSINGW